MKKRALPILTIFWESFLLFGIQPMVGRTLLPAFGGTAAVWVVCLCAYQVLLLAGYGYAFLHARPSREGESGATRKKWHIALLLLSAAWALGMVWLGPALMARVGSEQMPALQVLGCVLALIGFPYVLLSANSTLVQAWVSADGNGRGVYRLYAVSNAGSLAGLLAYPFLFEPYVTISAQWIGFAAGIGVYALLLGCLASSTRDTVSQKPQLHDVKESPYVKESKAEEKWAQALWLFLPAFSCFLLDALTSHITLDVMPMPLLWGLLLGVFLLSYIIGFSGVAERCVKGIGILSLLLFCGVCWLNGKTIRQVSMPMSILLYCAFLLTACSFVHAWLYKIRPPAKLLTRYYLSGALGGAVGGILASLVAPMVFKTVAEYPIALFTAGIIAVVYFLMRPQKVFGKIAAATGLALLASGTFLYVKGEGKEQRPVVYRGRGFFGTVEVLESKARTTKGAGFVREFVHGTTIHGIQALIPGKERMPTTYYTADSSGYAIAGHPKYRTGEPMRVNITGLGIGVMFCYGRTNDYYRAYEISKDAMSVAMNTNLFTFVSDCPAKKEIVLGDARKGLEKELADGVEPYDVIVVDAFTGDNLPYHLSTREAFDLYFKLLKPDGILAVNISNWHLTLEPFMKTVSDFYNVPLLGLETRDDFGRLAFGAKVAFFCRKPEGLAQPPLQSARMIPFNRYRPMPRLPTDERGSFIDLIRW